MTLVAPASRDGMDEPDFLALLSPSPLDNLDDLELYRLLGVAWYAQFRPVEKADRFLTEIGKREFDSLRSALREDLRGRRRDSVVACVTTTLRGSGAWRMPATVVAVLAVRHGLSQADTPEATTQLSRNT